MITGNFFYNVGRAFVMIKRIAILAFIMIALGNNVVCAAGGKALKITGKVIDEFGEPLIGVNINEVGTNNGVITDVNGNYTIYNVEDESSVLRFTYVGFKLVEIKIGTQSIVNVQMVSDTQGLDEVVVVGYGSQKKESVVGAITTVRPSALQANQTRTLSNALAGQLAGIIAVQRTGEPGYDSSDFWIRGKSPFGDATGVLIVLDGVEISSSDLNALDPEVIESFSILKDATATAMYGTRGANGVMIVTTKSGQDLLKPIINFRLETSMSQLTSVPEMVGGVDYMKLYNEALTTRGITTGLYDDTKIRAT